MVDNYDIANLIGCFLDDRQKVNILDNIWTPSKDFNFPVSTFGKSSRRCNYMWLLKYHWLTYSQINDGVYCKFCVFFAPQLVGQSSSQQLGALCTEPFKNWKKATEKFELHQTTIYHQNAIIKAENLKKALENPSQSIENLLNKQAHLQALENRKKLAPIIKTILFCGRNNLPLRGHRDSGPLKIQGDEGETELEEQITQKGIGLFKKLLLFRIEAGDDALKAHLGSSGENATYLSPNIQNQIIGSCNKIILGKLVRDVNESGCFSLVADETTDISNVEQLSVCVRYVKNNLINEHFLQFIPIENTSAENISNNLITFLKSIGMNMENLCGQGYDGASAMGGKISGVQARIREVYPAALYVHCASHSLNLAISKSCEVPDIRNTLGIIEKCYAFMNTPKREAVLLRMIDETVPTSKRTGLKQMCPTRWVEKHESVSVMCELYHPLIEALQEISIWPDSSTSSEARSLCNNITNPAFYLNLLIIEKVFSFSLPLCRILQTPDIDLSEAVNLSNNVLAELKNLRQNSDTIFDLIFNRVESILREIFQEEIKIKLPRITKKQIYRSNVKVNSPKEYYKITTFLPFLDHFIINIQERFVNHRNIIDLFSRCLLSTNASENDFLKLLKLYQNTNFIKESRESVLTAELKLWHRSIETRQANFKNAIDAFTSCNQIIYPNINVLLKIFCTLPVTSCTSERSFSTLRRLLTYLRNTTGTTRLNGLALLNIHSEISVSPDEVLDQLATVKRRLNINI